MKGTKWSFSLKGARKVSQRPPVVIGSRVLLTFNHGSGGTYLGTLICVDFEAGTELWRFEANHFLNEPVPDSQDFVYVTCFNGDL